jgi:hypothetical protein
MREHLGSNLYLTLNNLSFSSPTYFLKTLSFLSLFQRIISLSCKFKKSGKLDKGRIRPPPGPWDDVITQRELKIVAWPARRVGTGRNHLLVNGETITISESPDVRAIPGKIVDIKIVNVALHLAFVAESCIYELVAANVCNTFN